MSVRFSSTRPLLVLRGLIADRERPPLAKLGAISDPERFLWAVLPHAARTFAASIVVLPEAEARAAAVAYLYCRMLDTYEDLHPDGEARLDALRGFAARLDGDILEAPPPVPGTLAAGDRDRLHLLLVERCGLVDAVYATLPDTERASIRRLVASMADGMVWSTETFARQGGVLTDADQLAAYCHNVIGHPAAFTLELLEQRQPDPSARRDAFDVGEMIQLANVTRDIERDLARGIAYHPLLAPHLGEGTDAASRLEAVRAVRRMLTHRALRHAPAYSRLYRRSGASRRPSVRLAAVLMLLFTDLHYRRSLARVGAVPWPGPAGKLGVAVASLPALVSAKRAQRIITRVESAFLAAAATGDAEG